MGFATREGADSHEVRAISFGVNVGPKSDSAGWVAKLAFWSLVGVGLLWRELLPRSAGLFISLWCLGVFGIPFFWGFAGSFVTPSVAVIDILLVFIVFKGGIRLT